MSIDTSKIEQEPQRKPPRTILDEANDLVDGPREHEYGHPIHNHTTTANMMNTFLERKYGKSIQLTWHDVCMFNILQKISREANKHTRDNLVDICGYARNIEKCFDAFDGNESFVLSDGTLMPGTILYVDAEC